MSKYTIPHVAIIVNNLEETKEFYQKIGFSVLDEIYLKEKQRKFLLLEGYGLQIEAFFYINDDHDNKADQNQKRTGIMHFAVACENIEVVRDMIASKNVSLHKDISTSTGGIVLFFVEDPSGILVEFVEFPK